MIAQFFVFKQSFNTWPPRNGKPGGQGYDLSCLDATRPGIHALDDKYDFRLDDDQVAKWWGKTGTELEGRTIEVAVTTLATGKRGPFMRGIILRVVEADPLMPGASPKKGISGKE